MNETILNWKQAAIAWGEGKKVEWAHFSEWRWNDLDDEPKFLECLHYRLKPEADPQAEKLEPQEIHSISFKRFVEWHKKEFGANPKHERDLCTREWKIWEEQERYFAPIHEENEALKKQLSKAGDDFEDQYNTLEKELSQVKEERDRLRAGFITFESKDSNDEKPTPAEKTDNPIKKVMDSLNVFVLHERLERVEKAIKDIHPFANL